MNSEPAGGDSHAPYQTGMACNGVMVCLLAAATVMAVVGYRYGAPRGTIGGIVGAIGGVVVGILAAPVLFILLAAVVHWGIKLETLLGRRRD